MGNCCSSSTTSTQHQAQSPYTSYYGKNSNSNNKNNTNNNNTNNNTNNRNTNIDDGEFKDTIVGTLLQTLLPSMIPTVCKFLSKYFITDPEFSVLKYEKPLTEYTEEDHMEDQVIKDLELSIGSLSLVSLETLLRDMELYPSFQWPEKDRVRELMGKSNTINISSTNKNNNNNTSTATSIKNPNGRASAFNRLNSLNSQVNINQETSDHMTVVDLSNVYVKLELGKGIEFEIKLTANMNLEIGCGGKTIKDDAYCEFIIPKLRLWIVRKDMKDTDENNALNEDEVYIHFAFFGRPDVIPYLHCNIDRGNGDFMNIAIEEKGHIDDLLESILASYGPTEYDIKNHPLDQQQQQQQQLNATNTRSTISQTGKQRTFKATDPTRTTTTTTNNNNNKNNNKSVIINPKPKTPPHNQVRKSYIGSLIGTQISKWNKTENHSISLEMTSIVQDLTGTLTGRIRPVDKIEEDMERLQEELKRSKRMERDRRSKDGSFTKIPFLS